MQNPITESVKTQISNNRLNNLDLSSVIKYSVYEDVNRAIRESSANFGADISKAALHQELIRRFAKYAVVSEQNIIPLSGNRAALKALLSSLTKPGDKLLTNSVADSSAIEMFKRFKLDTDIYVEESDNINYGYFYASITDNTDFVYLQNPSIQDRRPIERTELKALLDHDSSATFILDETYIDLSGESMASLVAEYNNLIVIRSLSEGLGMANHNIEFLIADNYLATNINMSAKSDLTVDQLTSSIKNLDNLGLICRKLSDLAENLTFQTIYLRSVGIVCRPTCAGAILIETNDQSRALELLRNSLITAEAVDSDNLTQTVAVKTLSVDSQDKLDQIVEVIKSIGANKRCDRKITITRQPESKNKHEVTRRKVDTEYIYSDRLKGGAFLQEENLKHENVIPR